MISTDSGLPRAQRIGDGHLEPVLKQRPVRQIGQAVVIREVADALFGLRSLAPHLGIAQLAVDRGNEPVEIVLDDVVVGAVLHRLDRDFFADRAGHENERHFEAAVAHDRERRGSAEAGHRVIGDDEIPVALSSASVSAFGGIDAREIGLVPALPQVLDQERGVVFRVLDQQESQWSHAAGYRAIQAFVNCSAVWSRASTASASFSVLYLPTRTRNSAVEVPFTGSMTNAG